MAAVKPSLMLKKGLVTDLAIALGNVLLANAEARFDDSYVSTEIFEPLKSIGATMGSLFWHGYHMPRTLARDSLYAQLEKERAQKQGQ